MTVNKQQLWLRLHILIRRPAAAFLGPFPNEYTRVATRPPRRVPRLSISMTVVHMTIPSTRRQVSRIVEQQHSNRPLCHHQHRLISHNRLFHHAHTTNNQIVDTMMIANSSVLTRALNRERQAEENQAWKSSNRSAYRWKIPATGCSRRR